MQCFLYEKTVCVVSSDIHQQQKKGYSLVVYACAVKSQKMKSPGEEKYVDVVQE